ncbi:MAG TPA: AMP-binding protein, partial [Solirubrobacterales bacterium]
MEVTTSERHASGGAAPELPAQNLVKAFYAQVDRLGDDMAIRDEAREKELSWTDLRDVTHRIAGGLAKLGVEKGDTVAIML